MNATVAHNGGRRHAGHVPAADDPNIPALKKSCVTITGQIKDVYAARQQLVVSKSAALGLHLTTTATVAANGGRRHAGHVPAADDPNIPALKKSCVTITGQIKDVYAARQQLVVSCDHVPAADDPNIPALKKSCVTITGQIKDVYAARQQLVGSLPLVVIFDVSEEAHRISPELAARVMHTHNVFVNVRRKPKQGIASVVIKGIERCAGDIYEARRELLGGKEPSITAEVPESYNIPAIAGGSMPNFGAYNPFSPGAHSPCEPMGNSPYNMQTLADLANYASLSPMFTHSGSPGGFPAPLSPAAPGYPPSWIVPSPHHYQNANVMYKSQPAWNPMSNGNDGSMQPPMMMQPQYQPAPPEHNRPMQQTLSQMLNTSSAGSSGYQSNFTGSCVSLDTHNISGGENSNMVSPSVSPISKTHSPTPSSDTDRSGQDLANLISDMSISDRRAVGCEKKTLETLNKMSPVSEYRRMKAEASKAMSETVGGGFRVPTTRWSGYYFSHTSPAPLAPPDAQDKPTTPEKGVSWVRPELTRPNIAPAAPPCRYRQLADLLMQLGLGKYIELFKKHELDMSTFASLSEADLSELGVTAFGARRKMLLVIQELQKQGSGFKTSSAPGIDRKMTSPKYNTEALSEKDKW
ncbi:protein bicaudal C [Plutella xylostella]|uniref:protein bicaudal C n=1 Tax=Plutella xylostella TaxID=51655 RepID=UPI0020326E31|nr:protein bicaudal C [Plutella xylostella]